MLELTQLPTQLHIGKRPEPRKVNSQNGDMRGIGKPTHALWTSTWETAMTEGWLWWLYGEGYKIGWGHNGVVSGWLLEPEQCAVWTIGTPEDNEEFHRLYWKLDQSFQGQGYLMSGIGFIDWDRVWRDADAVRITNAHHPEIRFGRSLNAHPATFYGWDCESTAWLNWRFQDEITEVPKEELDRLTAFEQSA